MVDYSVVLPSQPRVVSEDATKGVYEIDGLYTGYGHTLGNSLRRIILSSLPGFAITSVKIAGVPHEFSTIDGVKEDVIAILLNLKKVRLAFDGDEPQTFACTIKGPKTVTAGDLQVPSQVRVLNSEQHIAELTAKGSSLEIEITIEKGLGYVPKEVHSQGKNDVGVIALDAIFTPIRRANYEVENMRVGDRTDYNRLRMTIETDGTFTPREALERSIGVMIEQLKAIVGFKEEEPQDVVSEESTVDDQEKEEKSDVDADALKTRIESLEELSGRTSNALLEASIRTVGGLVRKSEEDLLALEGVGDKSVQEIRRALANFGLTLKQ
jgi:DNA-directed RNA polymerase subunit alpha